MTGAAHRPERGSPEYRTAEQRYDSKTPRQALKNLHAAEQQLVAAQRSTAIARALAEIAAHTELMGASKRRALSAHYAGKVAALSPSLSPGERAAAIARLRDEEAAATHALDLDLKQTAANERSRTLMHLKQHFRSLTIGLRQRQRRQRATLGVLFRKPRQHPIAPSPRKAVRAVAARIPLRSTRMPPRTPR